jgi:hypothetical protein
MALEELFHITALGNGETCENSAAFCKWEEKIV